MSEGRREKLGERMKGEGAVSKMRISEWIMKILGETMNSE